MNANSRGYIEAEHFMRELRHLRRITHEPTLIQLYGKRIERVGHITKLSTVDESFLFGVMRAIKSANLFSPPNEHYGLMFDGDSDWIQVFYVW